MMPRMGLGVANCVPGAATGGYRQDFGKLQVPAFFLPLELIHVE
jgi:hypothetical protein